ncbi:MAG: hypothetical protein V3U76_18490 [Granulosicoccus sp.]
MPVLTILPHGVTGGFGGSHAAEPPVRSEINGWSSHSAKRNTKFLRSILHGSLTGYGYALSLTVRYCPNSHTDWQKLRNAFFQRLRRLGVTRCHWIVEWQRRRIPHMHLAIWFDDAMAHNVVIDHWLAVTERYESRSIAQDVKDIYGYDGWAKYVSKHLSRGLQHAQRCNSARPRGWTKSGRVWGKFGNWTTDAGHRVEMSDDAFWSLRRIIKRYRIAQVRQASEWKSLTFLRRSLKCADPEKSAVIGLNEWIPQQVQLRIIHIMLNTGTLTYQYY